MNISSIKRLKTISLISVTTLILAACSSESFVSKLPSDFSEIKPMSQPSSSYVPLENFSGRTKPIFIAVYDIPDLTGANAKNDDFAEFSKAVTQGADALVVEALNSVANGQMFRVLERKFSDALLTERRIVISQANEHKQRKQVQSERARISRDKAAVRVEINSLREKVEEDYARAAQSGQSELPPIDQTLANLERYRVQRLREIEAEIPFSVFSTHPPVANLRTAEYLITGAIVAYDSDLYSGGTGFRIFNMGGSRKIRRDMVTVNLRLVRVSSGEIIGNETVSQVVLSYRDQGDILNYITVNTVLEFESGYVVNEPKSLALYSAIKVALSKILSEQVKSGAF
jgi:curli biogenesis system outer membrane secretion channel CsgG